MSEQVAVTATSVRRLAASWARPGVARDNVWIPGRLIGGAAMIVGPLLWLSAMILRYLALRLAAFTPEQRASFASQPFAAPAQLAAYQQQPGLATAGYALFAAACIVLALAVLTLARVIAARSPVLAQLGAVAIVASLFGRLYFSGVDLTAFRLVDVYGLGAATTFVMESYQELSYGLWYVPVTASAGALIGGVLLSIGAFRADLLGFVRCALLISWAWTFLGVLKQSDAGAISGAIALSIVVVPIGYQVLRDRIIELRVSPPLEPQPSLRDRWIW